MFLFVQTVQNKTSGHERLLSKTQNVTDRRLPVEQLCSDESSCYDEKQSGRGEHFLLDLVGHFSVV